MPIKFNARAEYVILFLIGGSFLTNISYSQSLPGWSLEFNNYNAYTARGEVPFWFHSNQYGIYDQNSSNLILSLDTQKRIHEDAWLDYGLGIETIGRISDHSDAFFNQLYLELKIDFLNIYTGKKKWRDGLWTSDLSLGSMVWSSNAATMPKLMLYMPEFVSVPWTKDYLAFKAYLAHGWFEDHRFVKDTYLHEKAFYLKLMPHDFFAHGYIGAIHNVQWGGTHPTLGKLPQGADDFGRVFLGKSAEAGRSPGGEVVNALGNTVGAYEAMLELNFNSIDIQAYRQLFIETSVSADFRSPWDGIWGLKLNLQKAGSAWIKQFIWEHVNTKKQNAKPGEEIGADQYYANFLYRDGWTYKGRILGLPLVTLREADGRKRIINNIILAHHFGFEGIVPISFIENPISYKVLATYSRNYGRTTNCSNDFCDEGADNPLRTSRRDQYYTQFLLDYKPSKKIRIWGAAGADFGELPDEFGLFLGFSYSVF